MKKALFLMIVLGALIGCSSPEKKMKYLITDHLKMTLDDWKSYEPVSFGEIKRTYDLDLTDPLYKSYFAKADSFRLEAELCLRFSDDFFNLKDSQDFYIHKSRTITRPIGWRISHTFRSSNEMGATTIKSYWFVFDEDITKIIFTDTLGSYWLTKDKGSIEE